MLSFFHHISCHPFFQEVVCHIHVVDLLQQCISALVIKFFNTLFYAHLGQQYVYVLFHGSGNSWLLSSLCHSIFSITFWGSCPEVA